MAQVGSDSSETCRLLHLVRAGDAAACERLFARYRASLLRVIARRLGYVHSCVCFLFQYPVENYHTSS
jgi:hypothetical protein